MVCATDARECLLSDLCQRRARGHVLLEEFWKAAEQAVPHPVPWVLIL